MFITVPLNFKNQWVGYILADDQGNGMHADVVPFKELTALSGADLRGATGTLYITVVALDEDRLRLANKMFAELPQRGMAALQWKIQDAVQRWAKGPHGNGLPVQCVETGEQFASAYACANAHALSYGQLIKHLAGAVGYRTVKGRTYRKIGA